MKHPKYSLAVLAVAILAAGFAVGVKHLPPAVWVYLDQDGTLVLDRDTRVARLRDDRLSALETMRKGLESCAPDEFLPAWGKWQHLMVIESVDVLGRMKNPDNPRYRAYLEAQGKDEVDALWEGYRDCIADRTALAVADQA